MHRVQSGRASVGDAQKLFVKEKQICMREIELSVLSMDDDAGASRRIIIAYIEFSVRSRKRVFAFDVYILCV